MVERTKKQNKGFVSEQDVSTILQRYPATTVLTLLQEVAQCQDVKIDWNALVKKTTTGITNPREYQMLWRHLAYRDAFLEKFEDGAKPLDDDSDLEYDLEAFPPVSSDATTEAAACVKVLIASGLPSDLGLEKGLTVEAPLTINIPNAQSGRFQSENSQLPGSMKGTNITVPVSIQKQPLPTVTSAECLDANGNLPPRRKRKAWSEVEDMELIIAVQKCGEGNWANILKGDFKGDRTAAQLSQRWAIIRKRNGKLKVPTGSQLSESQLATRRAMSLALNMPMPMLDSLKASSSIAATNSNITTPSSNPVHPTVAETSSVGVHAQNQSQQDSAPKTSPKSRVISKKPSTKPSVLTPDAMVKAAAVAAGARIATPSDAASLLKAAHAKNAIHIMPSTASGPGSASPLGLGSHPNVHYIRTGLASTYSTVQPNASRFHSIASHALNVTKPAAPPVQSNQSSVAPESNASSDAMPNGIEVKTAQDMVISNSANSPKDFVPLEDPNAFPSKNAQRGDLVQELSGQEPKQQDQEEQASVSGNQLKENVQEVEASTEVQEDKVASISLETILKRDTSSVVNSSAETAGNDQMVIENTNGDIKIKDGVDNPSVVMEICEEDQSVRKNKDDSPSVLMDEKMEFVGNSEAGTVNGEKEKGLVVSE